jgi:hypothetical protein
MEQSKLSAGLSAPDSCDIDFLRIWLQSERGGDNFLMDSAAEATAWNEDQSHDLIALNKRTDRFAAWVANSIMPTYHRKIGHRIHAKLDDFSLGPRYWFDIRTFALMGNILCTFLASILPSSSIVILYFVESMRTRLLITVAFSTLFSLVMSIVAPGRRYEIFAATTAFAAVQVVFVGGVNVVVGSQQPGS